MKPIIENVSYTARRTADGVELVVEVERLNFVEEVIPDGEMAGMMGHRPVPCIDTLRLDIHPSQARDLWQQLGHAIGVVGHESL